MNNAVPLYFLNFKPLNFCLVLVLFLGLAACETGDESSLVGATDINKLNLAAIAVTPQNGSLQVGLTHQFKATGLPNNNDITENQHVIWRSSNMAVATVNEIGLVTAIGNGDTTISASVAGLEDSAALTVSDAPLENIVIRTRGSSSLTARACENVQLDAFGIYGGVERTTIPITEWVTWQVSSLSPDLGSSSFNTTPKGYLTVKTDSAITIQASMDGVTSDNGGSDFIITPVLLDSITIDPSELTLSTATTYLYEATGNYSDASTARDITANVSWSVDTNGATFSSATPGLIQTSLEGAIVVTAACGAASQVANLSIINRHLQYLRFRVAEDASNELNYIESILSGANAKNKQFVLQLVAKYSNSDQKEVLTSGVTWAIRPGSTDIISRTNADNGKITVTALGVGAVGGTEGRGLIDAKYLDQEMVFTVTVKP